MKLLQLLLDGIINQDLQFIDWQLFNSHVFQHTAVESRFRIAHRQSLSNPQSRAFFPELRSHRGFSPVIKQPTQVGNCFNGFLLAAIILPQPKKPQEGFL